MEMQMQGRSGLIFQSKAVGSIQKDKDGSSLVRIRGRGEKRFASEEEAQAYFNQDRTPCDPGNFEERCFKPARDRVLEKADKAMDKETMKAFDGLILHHLRHTFGSWKIEQGEDVLYVSAQMGHAKPSITFDIYSHLLENRRPHAAPKTDDLLFGHVSGAKDGGGQR